MTVRMAMAHDRHAGLWFSAGLGIGVGILMAVVISGLSYVLASSALLFHAIQYAGAAYLLYIGVKALLARPHNQTADDHQQPEKVIAGVRSISAWKAFQHGVITNILNPKGMVFFAAVATQFITPDTPMFLIALFGVMAMIIETTWFALVTLVLTAPVIKARFMGIAHWIERACGTLLIGLGIKLALTKVLP